MVRPLLNKTKLDLQPTIGNHDEEFFTCWYGKLQTFSKEFIKAIVNFCETTISKLAKQIKEAENKLKTAPGKRNLWRNKRSNKYKPKYSRPNTQTTETKEIPPIKV